MSAADWIAERHRIEQAAPPLPYQYGEGGNPVDGPTFTYLFAEHPQLGRQEIASGGYDSWCGSGLWFAEDACNNSPKMRAALEAVLALHWGEPCAQGPDYCAECEHLWPCETYSAITEALGVEP